MESPNESDSDTTASHGMHGDIAVVGLSCRLAGGIENPEDFWKALLEKQVKSGQIPAIRWEAYRRRDARNAKVLNNITKNGYFVENIEHFDAAFFGISPKEAPLIDPQQRLVLEAVWSALEDAGIPPQSLAGSNTAIYMGVNSDDYGKLLLEDLPGIEYPMGIGTAYCGVPNRVSYILDLQGPSTAVDAACASSLVAVHHGRMSLLSGETNVAIVGGVNAICSPGLTRVLDEAGAISSAGTCRSFDDGAEGYGRGEGAAVVILKRLEDALRDRDNVLAVIKGSAVGQDGRTQGIMAPNEHAQEKVARLALGNIEPGSIQYVEAHATSTRVGDPVEVRAMSHVYGADRHGQSCYIGSVKPNVGHLEAGAGVVGFMKAVLSIQKGIIAPQANVQTLNRQIDWKTNGLLVPVSPTLWPETVDQTRRAAVCSYGYGGSVSHVVLESAPQTTNEVSQTRVPDYSVILLSAPQEKRLVPDATALSEWISENGKSVPLSSIANTLASRREHHDFRLGLIVTSHEHVVESIKRYTVDLRGKVPKNTRNPQIIQNRCLDGEHSKGAAWLFSGHGAQWSEMGKELLEKDPVFSATIQELEPIVQEEMSFSMLQMLRAASFPSTEQVGPLTFAMQLGLVASLKSKGAQPAAVMGHSVGEIAAAVVAGVLTLREGALIACRRGRVFHKFQVMNSGTMALVTGIPYTEMVELLHGQTDIFAAIDSSPTSCVVSGKREAINRYTERWEKDDIKVTKIESDVPFHSALIAHVAPDLTELLMNDMKPKSPTIPLYSTTTEDAREQKLRDTPYWIDNMLRPVLLRGGVQALAADGYRVFVEVSTHPIITNSVTETLDEIGIEDYAVVPTMVRNQSSQRALLASLVGMWSVGTPIEWQCMFQGVDWAKGVPKTKFNRVQYWKEVETGPTDLIQVHDVHNHTLLGPRAVVAGKDISMFTTTLDNDSKPFPLSHPLHGTEIIPAAVLINTFLSATGSRVLTDMRLRVPVAVNAPRDIQVLVEKDSVRLMSRLIQSGELDENRAKSWLTHTTAETKSTALSDKSSLATERSIDISGIQQDLGRKLKDDHTKDYLADVGVALMGFPWKVTSLFENKGQMLARVEVCPGLAEGQQPDWNPLSWAPVLDAVTSIGSTLFYRAPALRMPAQITSVVVTEGAVPPKIAFVHVRDAPADDKGLAVDMSVTDENGMVLVEISSMKFAEIEHARQSDNLVYKLVWKAALMHDLKQRVLKHKIIIGNGAECLTSTVMRHLAKRRVSSTLIDSFEQLPSALKGLEEFAIFYIPSQVESYDDVPEASRGFCKELLDIVKYVLENKLAVKVFTITDDALGAINATALAHAPLLGLSRIIAAEHQDIWGALIDVDFDCFPFQVVEHMHSTSGFDIVRIKDGIPRVARLQQFSKEDAISPPPAMPLLHPQPGGTYLITGGLGALGLEVAAWMVEHGARRIILASRRALPPRKEWESQTGKLSDIIKKIHLLEDYGATIYSVAVDMSTLAAKDALLLELERLSLPPIRGVVHAAGVASNEMVHNTSTKHFNEVLDPKVTGAIVLHTMFPPGTVDFFVLFSSCGQLFGFPGQAAYASGNAFLDTLATHRRYQGDNAIAFQWTSWKGLGMAAPNDASKDAIDEELKFKGITDITRDEAFEAWEIATKLNTDHAVVLHTLELKAHQPLGHSILEDVVVRQRKHYAASVTSTKESEADDKEAVPAEGAERIKFFADKVTVCVAKCLDMQVDEVDSKKALLEMGMDSVITLTLRKELQAAIGVNISPTLVWSCPTVGHLAKHFAGLGITSCPKAAVAAAA